MSGYQYRQIFYRDYFNSQSGRTFRLDINKKLHDERLQLEPEILPLIPADKNARILDMGCGFGSLLYLLKEKGYTRLTGIDVSEGQVQVAHEIGLKDIVEKQDLIPYLSANPGVFDVITGLDIIEHFSKDELVDVLTLVHKALKPGGIAIFRTPNMDAPFASLYANGDFTHENYLNYSSARQVMMNIGFSDTEVTSSYLYTKGFIKELIRKVSWTIVSASIKLVVFASARTSRDMILTPNLLIRATK